MTKRRVAILISGRGSNMAALIKAAKDPTFPAEIVLVMSNIANAGGLERAQAAGIAAVTIESKSFGRDREAFERAMHDELVRHNIDLVCLAGFLRLLTPWFVQQWQGRMINIHPALLPAYRGLHTHERALADGVKIHGATVHFVVPDVDAGPIIVQGAVAVHETDTADTLAARVLEVEHQIYPQALRMVASGQTSIIGALCRATGATATEKTLISPSP
ncbi:phosphoribosylglycinamide formyltransferase [Afipia carboxidovorans OM5]|uniref:Phosphoribosylglycinamide formyltransferase n=1 Tax=Afipia carboxidovorans (strain ATCC 49405 / DSM 1227 / KCTC 32145 / OM5) TaxID=504832 RepID=B6JGK7_AFIC5|nr:phosphoribosylglycinamide formyltransferase [Afipia carboxidovorans]ACI93457.1 phosphoribosylglycinamide formyltransferase [Afipia carboxidovorans OM5]AEI02835.1 phosphoribosylglycinamide formyltransferase PurN [Afipia carboxidovorans OM4]AEI06411.1 phosphoribosylglycinamide formyltransferase PurN [Afipia carboxidovorans OM5]BEV47211.1 phosphoribosylglycinamide formyltransferase [Afipia carboxidovorans]